MTESMLDPARPPSSPGARVGDAARPAGEPATGAGGQTQAGPEVRLEGLRAFYGETEQVRGIDLRFPPNQVTAIIGPSGCGKSTMLRCINRMHEEIPGARAEGRVLLDDLDVYAPSVDVIAVRRAVGMVFQRPNPFPTMSIFDNVAAGLRLTCPPRRAAPPRRGRAARRRPLGGGRRPPLLRPAWGSPAGSSSGCASPARWPWAPRCC